MSEITFSDDSCLTPEGIDFEVKECGKTLPKSFWETYSSFANTFGGTIALGIKELGGKPIVSGIDDVEKIKKTLWDLLNDPKKVSVNLLTDRNLEERTVNGKTILLVRIPRAPADRRPVYVNNNIDNGTYRRNGEGDYHCSLQELREMFRNSTEESLDTKIIENVELRDLDAESIGAYRNIMSSRMPNHPWISESNEEFLRLIGAVGKAENGELRPTLAGLLMFGRAYTVSLELPQYRLDYFEPSGGPDEWTYRLSSDTGDWSGNLFDFYTKVSNRIFTNSEKPFKLKRMMRVDDTELIKAQREAVLNGIIHADYFGTGGIRIESKPDSLTVRNPGSFRIPIEKAKEGGTSVSRNVHLMNMFTLIGAVERAGSGIHRIVKTCKKMDLSPPVFAETTDPSAVTVKISFARMGISAEKGLGEAIKDLMVSDGTVSIDRISELLSVSKSSISRAVKDLKNAGEIERIGGTRGVWRVR